MDEQAVREHAQATCEALLAGDIGKAAEEMSKELRSTLGQIVATAADADDRGQHRVHRVDPDRLQGRPPPGGRGGHPPPRDALEGTATAGRPSSRRAACTRSRSSQ